MCSRYDKIQHTELFFHYMESLAVEWEIEVMESEMEKYTCGLQSVVWWVRKRECETQQHPTSCASAHTYIHTHTVLDHLRKTTKKPNVKREEKKTWMNAKKSTTLSHGGV